MKKHYRHENNCLNCGTILQGHFCHVCGQENLEIKEGFGHVMGHTISDYFHFDHQFFHTIRPLLFKPGFLTVEYMAGRRVQYLHPIKTYIFISVVYFLLLFQSGHEAVNVNESPKPTPTAKVADSVKTKIAKNTNISSTAKRKILKQAVAAQSQQGVSVKIGRNNLPKDGSLANTNIILDDSTYAQYLARQKKKPAADRDGFINQVISRKILTYHEKYGNMGNEVILEEIQHNIPKMMFLLLPIVAIAIGIAFRKNKKFYVEHLIYTFHLHCFLFLFLAIVLLLHKMIPYDSWFSIALSLTATLYIIWYVYRSLRVVYQRNTLRTITKMIGISFVYLVALIFCITFVSFITTLM